MGNGLPVDYETYQSNPTIPHKIVSDLYDEVFGILSFGPVGSGSSDTAVFEKALDRLGYIGATGKRVALYVPPYLDCLVDLDVLSLGDQVAIFGGGHLRTLSTTAGAFLTAPSSTGAAVDGMRFSAPNDLIMAIQLVRASDFAMTNNRCAECALTLTNDGSLTYANADTSSTGNISRDITITGNRITRTATNLGNVPAIMLHYTKGATVAGNRIDGSPYGIQWWGGDANPAADGALANERKCGDFAITGNIVRNITSPSGGAGIWGSMGESIAIDGNTVTRCNDVGIDLEGCFHAAVTGNTVKDCNNGQLTTFSYSVDVLFSGNTCRSDVANGAMARVQNGSGTPNVKDVRFIGNSFHTTNGIGLVLLETAESVEFSGNQLRNCSLYTRLNNQKFTTARHNSLVYDTAAGSAFNAMDFGANNAGGELNVTGNTVVSTVAQPAGSKGIYAAQIDSGVPPLTVIDANRVKGFPIPIENEWAGPLGAGVGHTLIRDNIIPVGTTIVQTESGGAVSVVVKQDNLHDDLSAA